MEYGVTTPTDYALNVFETGIMDGMGEVIMDGIVVVLPFVALLIGVFFLWRVIRRAVGSSRG